MVSSVLVALKASRPLTTAPASNDFRAMMMWMSSSCQMMLQSESSSLHMDQLDQALRASPILCGAVGMWGMLFQIILMNLAQSPNCSQERPLFHFQRTRRTIMHSFQWRKTRLSFNLLQQSY